jgi:hypothetical protein
MRWLIGLSLIDSPGTPTHTFIDNGMDVHEEQAV